MRRRRWPLQLVYRTAHCWTGDRQRGQALPRTQPRAPGERTHLHQSPRLLAQLVVVLELHGDGFVAVQARQLHVRGVAHKEGAEEIRGSDSCGGGAQTPGHGGVGGGGHSRWNGGLTCAGSHPHDGVKPDDLLNVPPEVVEKALLVCLSLGGTQAPSLAANVPAKISSYT